MNIYFSGIGGVGLGPLAEIAQDAGHTMQGSDPQDTPLTDQLAERGVALSKDQSGEFLKTQHEQQPIDWFVYTSALSSDHPELAMARQLGIKTTKRDEFLELFLNETGLKMIAVAGTHGKTGTTALLAWVFRELNIPVSYSIGTTIRFGPSGRYAKDSEYFIYECDEYDRNFLRFHPYLSIVTSVDYDHPDTYPTQEEYSEAFRQFLGQSQEFIMWRQDATFLGIQTGQQFDSSEVLSLRLPGAHIRRNATLVVKALDYLGITLDSTTAIENFPGAGRRFERLGDNVYTDYGHHPAEIAVQLQMAREISDHVVLVYQPHQNLRQHEVRHLYTDCFEDAEEIYWLPTYLTREKPGVAILSADELTKDITNRSSVHMADLNDELWEKVQQARRQGKLVLFMGAGTIDGWVRERTRAEQN